MTEALPTADAAAPVFTPVVTADASTAAPVAPAIMADVAAAVALDAPARPVHRNFFGWLLMWLLGKPHSVDTIVTDVERAAYHLYEIVMKHETDIQAIQTLINHLQADLVLAKATKDRAVSIFKDIKAAVS